MLSKTICCPAKDVIFKSVRSTLLIVLPSILILSTRNAVNVPKLVTFVCAAVASVPVILPDAVNAPSILTTPVPFGFLK